MVNTSKETNGSTLNVIAVEVGRPRMYVPGKQISVVFTINELTLLAIEQFEGTGPETKFLN